MGLEILLHIGRHKSGTSSLQSYLHGQADHYRSQGVHYPRAGRTLLRKGRPVTQIAHHQLAHSFLDSDPERAKALQTQVLGMLRAELPRHGRVILSSESFGNLLHPQQILAVRTFLDALEPERITVFAYVREYLDYIVSGYRQRVQNSHDLVALSDFSLLRSRRYSLEFWLEAWRSVGTLVCRRFAREALLNGDVVTDFCLHAGLDLHHGAALAERNPSIGGNLLFVKCALNLLGVSHPSLYARLGEQAVLDPAYRRPFPITEASARLVRERCDWNSTMEQLFGAFALPGFDTYPSCPERLALEDDLAGWAPLLDLVDVAPERIRGLMDQGEAWFQPSI